MEHADRVAYVPTIREMPNEARPRERLIAEGAGALSPGELLAIILRVGGQGENAIAMANRLLVHFGGLAGLARANVQELCLAHGMGEAKATQIKAALELGRRMHLATPEERTCISSPREVANLVMMEMGLLDQEELRVVLLDTKNYVVKITRLYTGSLNMAIVRVGEIFREPIRSNAASIILIHNHPSGDPTPSREDISLTEAVVQAGDLLNIDVLDHLIIGRNTFASLKERRLGFK
jgi:DNA repair protein RadC